jgi:DNA-binding NarL/FixJ family response regulator
MESKITVLVIEHQPLTRLGIKTLLSGADGIELLGEAADPRDGFRQFAEFQPEVTILGLRFPDSCSIDDLERYLEERPKARIIMLADHAGDAEISRALKKGAVGYVTKDVAPHDLVDAIRKVAAGRKYIPDDLAQLLSENLGQEELTPTESNILQMIVGGMSNKEIAFALDISENTVKTHNQNIFSKIGVNDRTSAAAAAIKRGLVRVDI